MALELFALSSGVEFSLVSDMPTGYNFGELSLERKLSLQVFQNFHTSPLRSPSLAGALTPPLHSYSDFTVKVSARVQSK